MPRSMVPLFLVLMGSLAGAEPTSTQPASQPAIPLSTADVEAVFKPLVDDQWCAGVTVAWFDTGGRHVLGLGKVRLGGEAEKMAPDGRTLYEIGSVSKTFTGLLLAEMVDQKQVSLDDPVQRYLPGSVKLPPRDAHRPTTKPMESITLVHLATQRSGLPRMPDNLKPADPSNPYADYTVEQMYDFLSRYELTREPGAAYEYSNLGMGLLGHVLSLKTGKPYEQLLVEGICHPLNMGDTRIALSADQKGRLSRGYDGDLNPQPNWDIPAFAGAGAIRSTADDMLKYIEVQAGVTEVEPALSRAVSLSHEIRADVDATTRIALAWHVDTRHGLYWHNGQTGGYHSYVAFSPRAKVGIVVLSNTATGLVDAAGQHLLARMAGYTDAPFKLSPIAKLDAKTLDRCVGQYLAVPGVVITITRDDDRLFAKLTGQPKARIYPSSQTEFFWKAAPARATFTIDDKGEVTKMVIHQGGRDLPALRVHPEIPLQ